MFAPLKTHVTVHFPIWAHGQIRASGLTVTSRALRPAVCAARDEGRAAKPLQIQRNGAGWRGCLRNFAWPRWPVAPALILCRICGFSASPPAERVSQPASAQMAGALMNLQTLAAAARPQRLALRGSRPARVCGSGRRSAAQVVYATANLTSSARPSAAELARTAVDISTDGTLYIVGSDGWPLGAHASYVLDAEGQPVIQAPANAAYRAGLEKDNVKCSLFVQVSSGLGAQKRAGSFCLSASWALTRSRNASRSRPRLGQSCTEQACRGRASPPARRWRSLPWRSSARCAAGPARPGVARSTQGCLLRAHVVCASPQRKQPVLPGAKLFQLHVDKVHLFAGLAGVRVTPRAAKLSFLPLAAVLLGTPLPPPYP